MECEKINGITPNPESVAITLTKDGKYIEATLWFGGLEGRWWSRDTVTCSDKDDAMRIIGVWKRVYKHTIVEDNA